jgi:hypothetical protein
MYSSQEEIELYITHLIEDGSGHVRELEVEIDDPSEQDRRRIVRRLFDDCHAWVALSSVSRNNIENIIINQQHIRYCGPPSNKLIVIQTDEETIR